MSPRRSTAAAAVLSAAVIAPSASAAVPPRQPVVALVRDHPVHLAPRAGTRVVAVVRATRPITRARTVLPVLSDRRDGLGRSWLRVRLPGRVLGTAAPPATGWVLARDTLRWTTPLRLVIDRRARRVTLLREGRVVRTGRAVVGAPATRTPAGPAFVEETVRLGRGEAGGPYALALSARSPVLQEFAGGPGQIAVHGRRGIGGTLGTAVSHGCVRVPDRDVAWLAARVGPGVPVTIR